MRLQTQITCTCLFNVKFHPSDSCPFTTLDQVHQIDIKCSCATCTNTYTKGYSLLCFCFHYTTACAYILVEKSIDCMWAHTRWLSASCSLWPMCHIWIQSTRFGGPVKGTLNTCDHACTGPCNFMMRHEFVQSQLSLSHSFPYSFSHLFHICLLAHSFENHCNIINPNTTIML